MLALVAGSSGAETEPNDDYDQAEPIEAGTYSGNIDRKSEPDYYRFEAGEGDIIELELWSSSGGGGYDLELMNITKDRVGGVHPGFHKTNNTFYYTSAESPTQVYYLVLQWFEGDYVFHLRLHRQDDAGMGMDAPCVFDDPPVLPGDVLVNGTFGNEDQTDVYALNFTPGQKIKAELSYESGTYVKAMITYYTSVMGVPQIEFTREVTYGEYWTASESRIDMYYLVVHVNVPPGRIVGQGSYSMRVSLEDQDDADTGGDVAGWTDWGARWIEEGFHTGEMGYQDDADYYEIRVWDEMTVFVEFDWDGPDEVTLSVNRQYGLTIDSITSSNGTPASMELTVECDPYWGEDWEIHIDAPMEFEPSEYFMNLRLTPMVDEEPPVIELVHIGKWTHGEDMEVMMRISDNKIILSSGMLWRMVGDERFSHSYGRSMGYPNYTFAIPGENVTEKGVEWYVYASDRYNHVMYPENGNVTPIRFPPPVNLEVEPPLDPEFGNRIAFKFKPECEYDITDMTFHYRMDWSGMWCSTVMTKIGSTFIIEIDEHISGGTLEYYAVAKDEWGFKTYYGTADAPHEITIKEEEPPPKKDDSDGFGHMAAMLALVLVVLTIRYRSSVLQ
jgi:hypothetical protein